MDDIRQATSEIKHGVRYCIKEEKFIYKDEWEREDRENGESDTRRMSNGCRKAMCSIYSNLNFTMEIHEDFENLRLPTLDFELFVHEGKEIRHSYYEKPMNTPYVIMERSAISEQSKISILANDLIRRLSNVGENIFDEEKYKVIDHYTEKLQVSGYKRKQVKEIISSGLRGFETKRKRAEKEKRPFYRKAKDTLKGRIKKKLTEKTKWYKRKKKIEGGNKQKGERKRDLHKEKTDRGDSNKVKAVLFVPRTSRGELAKRIREKEIELEKVTGFRFKVVERAGTNLEKILHKSNPWAGKDCGRVKCLLCETKGKSDEQPQSCSKRNTVYKITCEECEKLGQKGVYIGESARSCYERGKEHLEARENLKPDSHMLKHVLLHHREKDIREVKFKMRSLKFHKSAFERQIHEAVAIQSHREDILMNSKSEYNRCSVPRLSVKYGKRIYTGDSEIEELAEEQQLEEEIKKMRKTRKLQCSSDGPRRKRRKLNIEAQNLGEASKNENKKRKREVTKDDVLVTSPKRHHSVLERACVANSDQKIPPLKCSSRRRRIRSSNLSLEEMQVRKEKFRAMLETKLSAPFGKVGVAARKSSEKVIEENENHKTSTLKKFRFRKIEDEENVAKKVKNEKIVKKIIRKIEKGEKMSQKSEEKDKNGGGGSENVAKVKVLKNTPQKFAKKGVGGSQKKTKLIENNPKKVSKLIEMFENVKGANKNEIEIREKSENLNSPFKINSKLSQTSISSPIENCKMKKRTKKEHLTPKRSNPKKITDFFPKYEDPQIEKRIGSKEKFASNEIVCSSTRTEAARALETK